MKLREIDMISSKISVDNLASVYFFVVKLCPIEEVAANNTVKEFSFACVRSYKLESKFAT